MKTEHVKTATDKYDVFTKVFVQLSDESQDKLVKVAHHLLKTHKLAKHKSLEQKCGKGEHFLCNSDS